MLLSREGRENLFGVGKEKNKQIRWLNSEARERFRRQYPEVRICGNYTEFDGGVQYLHDGIVQVCELREGYEIEKTYKSIIRRENVSEVSKFYVSEGDVRQIPNTFIQYRSFREYTGYYKRSLNIVLADLWLRRSFPDFFETKRSRQKTATDFDEDQMGLAEFMSLISSAARKGVIPVKKGRDFLSLGREDMLLAVSRVLHMEGVKSTLHEEGLDFSCVDEKHFFMKQDIYNNDGEGIEFWCGVLFYKMNCSYDVYGDKPTIPVVF